MTGIRSVRASHDGDQFHFLWASRRCLKLLSPQSGLVAVVIEGTSPLERDSDDDTKSGMESIDVSEYWDDEDIKKATKVRYTQLRHSTFQSSSYWKNSELQNIFRGFARYYMKVASELKAEDIPKKLEFWFVSNRPIRTDRVDEVEAIATDPSPCESTLSQLENLTGLSGNDLVVFCKLLNFDTGQEGYIGQSESLAREVESYLPGPDMDAPVQLKELVTQKALTKNADNPTITKFDVLRSLKATERDLFPAPCQIESPEHMVPREQEFSLLQKIAHAGQNPILIHAEGGVGKSVFAKQVSLSLPQGSYSVLYDCFGNGQYRSVSGYRHQHKVALVQIVNELASKGLSDPLIPAPTSEPTDYMHVFLHRLEQSVAKLQSGNSDALLYIFVDAVDNAQIASKEASHGRSFAYDLLRETMPQGVRLVMFCRTHRRDLLNPPHAIVQIELKPFSRTETAKKLRYTFPNASGHDVEEFHRLSSCNPRVQNIALESRPSLHEILTELGPNPTTVEDTISHLFEQAISRLRSEASASEEHQIDLVCAGLAALRPYIPLEVLATLSKVDEAMIRTFVMEFGTSLRVVDDAVQFFDEPTETWFRDKFKPAKCELKNFIERLMPFASTSPYIASALPQLMLEAGQTSELVELALESGGLPDFNPIERQHIEFQRLQSALKACLRKQRYADAAKLSIKAGGESAGDERRQYLLGDNIDLVAVFTSSDGIHELVSKVDLNANWMGSCHAYEAGLMSWHPSLHGDALSRIRMAREWLIRRSTMPDSEREDEDILPLDIAEIAIAQFNIRGAEGCVEELLCWKPRKTAFEVACIIVRRFIDHGKYHDIDELALASKNSLRIILACTLELRKVGRIPPRETITRAMRMVRLVQRLGESSTETGMREAPGVIFALVEAACIARHCNHSDIECILDSFELRPVAYSEFGSSWNHESDFLRIPALRTALAGGQTELVDVAPPHLKEKIIKGDSQTQSDELRAFRRNIGAMLPWHNLFAMACLEEVDEDQLDVFIDKALADSNRAMAGHYAYDGMHRTQNEIALIWGAILLEVEPSGIGALKKFSDQIHSKQWHVFPTGLIQLSRMTASREQNEYKEFSIKCANKVFQLQQRIQQDKNECMDAESRMTECIDLARAVLAASRKDAEAYFNEAIRVSSKIGEENGYRWDAILALANRLSNVLGPKPQMAYKLSRCAELTYKYVAKDSHFPWDDTVKAITDLCPSSSLAILSRWRDRNFGWSRSLLPICVQRLVRKDFIDAKTALALFCFRFGWKPCELLDSALARCLNAEEKKKAFDFFFRYYTLDFMVTGISEQLQEITRTHGLDFPELEEIIRFQRYKDALHTNRTSHENQPHAVDSNKEEDMDWQAIFAGLDISRPDDINVAYRKFTAQQQHSYHDEHFFQQLFPYVGAGKEADFIDAVGEMEGFGLHRLHALLKHWPHKWRGRIAIRNALGRILKKMYRRYGHDVVRKYSYDATFFKNACALADLDTAAVMDEVLSTISLGDTPPEATDLFAMAKMLAIKLSETEACEVLSYSLDLMEAEAEEEDGDGPWIPELRPPHDVQHALAGYVWATLAAPEAGLRWEAAHVVRGFCALGCTNVIRHLVGLAATERPMPFVDPRLHFYHFHAMQWLMIALARSVCENPHMLIPHIAFIRDQTTGNKHVLIRGLAAKTMLALADKGMASLTTTERGRLASINVSKLPRESSRAHGIGGISDQSTPSGTRNEKYHFSYDIGRYWFRPFAGLFGKSESEIADEATQIVRGNWNIKCDDVRLQEGIYQYKDVDHSHGSRPRVDDLRFYLAYHALMVIAGRRLDTEPLLVEDNPWNSFESWLRCHNVARADGLWVADRKDPAPLESPAWKVDKPVPGWLQGIEDNDFEKVLIKDGRRLVLWGHWEYVSDKYTMDRRKESVSVRSALVLPDKSLALLRALSTAVDHNVYGIPDIEDDRLQIDSFGFQLQGWVFDAHNSDYGLDDKDPWAENVVYPAIRPAEFVVEKMGLHADSEHRIWKYQGNDAEREVIWSCAWGEIIGYDGHHEPPQPEAGRWLQAEFDFIIEFLQAVEMDMVVGVYIERALTFYCRERQRTETERHQEAKLFVIRSDGRIHTA